MPALTLVRMLSFLLDLDMMDSIAWPPRCGAVHSITQGPCQVQSSRSNADSTLLPAASAIRPTCICV